MAERDTPREFEKLHESVGDLSPTAIETAGDIDLRAKLFERLSFLRDNNLGRPIVSKTTGGAEPQLFGLFLPLKVDQTRHLAVFTTGDMLIIEPRDPDNPMIVQDYKNAISNTGESYESAWDTPNITAEKMRESKGIVRATHSNNDPAQEEEFLGNIDKAILIAKKVTGERERVKRESMRRFIGSLNETFEELNQELDQRLTEIQEQTDTPPLSDA